MNRLPLQAVRGMNDILPDEAQRWEGLEALLRLWLKNYGYRPLRMPLVESTFLFSGAIGTATDIVDKEMYSWTDALNGDSLTLRPEGTASCVRAALEHHLLYDGPKRLWYMGPMFRHEKPQQGRYRQFHQIGVEALGFAGPDIDAEHILMGARLWHDLKISPFVRLEINSLGAPHERAAHRLALIDYLRAHIDGLDHTARERLETNPLRILDSKNPALQALIASAPSLLDYLQGDSLTHFECLQKTLQSHGIAYRINPRLVRGLDYYHRTVFEWVSDQLGAQGTICAGGRYDGLIAQLGGKPTPACGFAIGLERLLALVNTTDDPPWAPAPPAVYVVHQGHLASAYALTLAEILRDKGIETLYHCGEGGFKAQMKRADKSGALLALIIGDDEALAGRATLKSLRTDAPQHQVDRATLIETIRSLLGEVNRHGHL
jgi:histidyl-tRNA synthetase